jgi:hypothetical protein
MTNKEEIAKLKQELADQKAKVEALERAAKPPEPFKPAPYQQYDPTANMSMPMSTMMEMARAVPTAMLRDIVHDNRAPTGRPGMIPSQQVSSAGPSGSAAGDGTGWAREIPLGPPAGIRYVDQQMDAQDAKDRADRTQQQAQTEAMRRFAEQTEIINKKLEAIGSKLAGQKK